MISVVSRQEARKKGFRFFFTGQPCANGHIVERYTCDGRCTTCKKEYVRIWRAENPEKVKAWYLNNKEAIDARSLAWSRANKDKVNARRRRYEQQNPEKRRTTVNAWRKKNPEARRAIDNRRRARKRNAPGSHTAEDVRNLLALQKCRCGACTKKLSRYHIDHIMPLANGGSNDTTNIQLLCPSCNHRKSSKDPIAWAQENGRLL